MKESDISKHDAGHRQHEHEINVPDAHSKEGHKHSSSESIKEAEKHVQHKEKAQPKERKKTMRKIAASIICFAALGLIGSSPVANGAIKIKEIGVIQKDAIQKDVISSAKIISGKEYDIQAYQISRILKLDKPINNIEITAADEITDKSGRTIEIKKVIGDAVKIIKAINCADCDDQIATIKQIDVIADNSIETDINKA